MDTWLAILPEVSDTDILQYFKEWILGFAVLPEVGDIYTIYIML
jgi:hypothetical protein